MTFKEFLAEDQFTHDKVRKTYNITASPELLERLETFLSYLQWCAFHDVEADIAFHMKGEDVNFFVQGLKLWKRSLLKPINARVERPA
jgi:hypothetical protein